VQVPWFNNILGFKKPNYTDNTRLKQLSKLKQFKNYTMSSSKNITKPKSSLPLLAEDKVVMLEADLQKGYTLTELLEDKDSKYQISSYKFYKLLKENQELDRRITEARKIGIQTLIDRLLQIFNTQQLENPNLILWTEKRMKFTQWLAGKLTDIYSDNKPQQVKQDQNITIRFESGIDEREIIELDPEKFEFTPGPVSTIKKD
jgi:hypothetical protein